MIRPPPRSTLFPNPTLSRSRLAAEAQELLGRAPAEPRADAAGRDQHRDVTHREPRRRRAAARRPCGPPTSGARSRSEEHTSELQSQSNLVCRLLLEKKKKIK